MADKLVLYPSKLDKRALHRVTGLSILVPTARAGAKVQPSGKDNAYFCDSAFLAERGCLWQERSPKHPAAAHRPS